jgi:glyoxylase-like metal-dependent hydrolase (beta-lactamase superfamily II)
VVAALTDWEEVGDGCFRRLYESWHLNVGVVRGREALLVVDTRANLPEADQLLADLRYFGRPVRWVVNSHWHFDHSFGNQRFLEAAQRPAEDANRAEVLGQLELWGHADMPARLLRNQDPAFRQTLRNYLGDRAEEFDREYDRVVLTPPDRLVQDRQTIDMGDRNVDLLFLGRGHTTTDIVVRVPDAGVVYAGDLLEDGSPFYGNDSYPLEWPDTVASLLNTGVSFFVPGHGGVMSPAAAARQAAELTTVANLIRELHAAGVAQSEALDEAGDRWPYPRDALAQAAVRRGYEAFA